MRTMLIFTLAAAAAGVASSAPPPGAAEGGSTGRQCFLVDTVRNFSGEGDGSIIVHASRRQAFELTAIGYCQDIDWANQVALRTFGGTSSLCVGEQADLIVRPLGGPTERCRVEVTRALTPEQVEALRQNPSD